MKKLFVEFENENASRTYPFASGCTVKDTKGNGVGVGILIDAALYPVNAEGPIYLSSILPGGIVNISDDTGIIMTAAFSTGESTLEFYDSKRPDRHVGTILAASEDALASLANVDEIRKFKKAETLFASSCVFPIVNDGVTSINVSGTGISDGDIRFSNGSTEDIRISTDGSNLRFDVLPNILKTIPTSIQHIYCVVDGKTPFRIQKIPFGYESSAVGNTVAVYLDNIERSAICSNANRETSLEMVDTCEECEESSSDCHTDPEKPTVLPDTYQVEVVDIDNNAENAFYLAVPNFLGYDNPLSITMTDGAPSPKLEMKIEEATTSLDAFTDKLTSKGIVIQVPGLKK